jgi:fungalysin metallopeptidase (M36)/PA domain-containing protein
MRCSLRTFAVPSLLFAAACATGSNPSPDPSPDPDNPGAPGDPGAGPSGTSLDQAATNLGVTVMARDEHGAPRLLRSIVPRAGLRSAAPEVVARDHVAALAPLWVQGATPMALVETGTQQLRNGATIVQLAQQAAGVVVDQGELRVLLHVDGSLAAVTGTLRPATDAPAAPMFVSSPREALEHALDQQFGPARPALAIQDAGDAGGWQTLAVAATPQLQVSEARARRVLAPVDNRLAPVWEIEVLGEIAPDPLSETQAPVLSAHSYLVSDASGKILRDVDLDANDAFVYRAYAETTGNRRPLDGPLQSFAPHPTGVPDGSAPGLIPSNLVVIEAFNTTVDKWLPDNATTAAGNNAEAFADLDGNNAFSAGDIRPEVRSGRILSFTYNHQLEPLATPDQSKAGAVNAFFLVNWMHDWWYDSGFTEITRNGQLDNLGRGGVANDRLLIAAQAGATAGSRNNASMATPADGARPRMRMFLWTAGADSLLTGPGGGAIPSATFSTGPRTFSATGELVIGLDATAPTDDGCQAITNVTGKIALLTYAAQCNSQISVNNARAAGAIGVILADGELDQPRLFGGSAAANLPGLVIGKSDGLALKAALANGPVTVTLASTARGPERDGDLDNTVVAHEWGHYLHHRLAACGASQQCAGMSEGWGDFNALLMMLREGDNRDGVYAMAPYAIGDGSPNTAYFGIRRFPYSRDRTKNDLSFRHIDDQNPLPTTTPGFPAGVNSEVHNTGEVWTTMMWEVLNVLADAHGVTVARRRMTDYVVAGMLLAPTNATFTEQRDAILIGASALDTDDMLVMAAAFAGRGLGSCAISPPRSSTTNLGAVESTTIAAKLATGTATITDDGPRSNRNGVLEPGESGLVHLTIANGGAVAAEQVTLTATASTTAIQFGPPRSVELLPAFATVELTIPVTVSASLPVGASVTVFLHVAGEDTCVRNGLDVRVPFVVGVASGASAPELPRIAAASPTAADRAPAIRMAPATSLRDSDAGMCIAQDRP